MRLAFLGTPAVACEPLIALFTAGHSVEVVVTGPDKRRGRGSALMPSPVKETAIALGLPVVTDVDAILGQGIDLGVVVAYGRIIKPHVLAQVPMVNLHFSLLPRWRGAAPVERAILAGDQQTGVCLMEVVEGLDEGGVYAVEATPIEPEESVAELRRRLTLIGIPLLLDRLAQGLGVPVPQVGVVTYAAKITSDESHLDWAESAEQCHARVRLGRAWTQFRGIRLQVLRATVADGAPGALGEIDAGLGVACGDGRRLQLLEVQPAGRSRMPARAWSIGARPTGERLG